jgi:hypothetical protein
MSKRDYVRDELADIERQIADKDPDDIGEDMSDLAAIGLARYDPKITPEQIAELVAAARGNGRSWDQIGNRLGMSGEETRKTYGRKSSGQSGLAIVVGGAAGVALIVLRHLVRNLGRVPR